MVFGCPPYSNVPADSTVTVELFQYIWTTAKPADGSIVLPGKFLRWKPGGRGDILPLISNDLLLRQVNHDPAKQSPLVHDEELKKSAEEKAR